MGIRTFLAGLVIFALVEGNALGQQGNVEERLKDLDEAVEELENELMDVREQAEASRPGTTTVLVSGNTKFNFTAREGENPTTSAVFSPHILWKLGARGFFESHVDIKLQQNETVVNLEFANFSYIITDYVILEVGKFLTPFGFFQENVHAAWMNKLPDEPLSVANDSLTPTSSLGIQLRGVIPVGFTVFKYAIYLSNGPRLNVGVPDSQNAGKLKFDNYTDNNRNKAVGGRVGFSPVPELEIGSSFLTSKVGSRNTPFSDIDAFLFGVDLNYVKNVGSLMGTVDVKTEWIWSKVDTADYGAGVFDNKRKGGYLQLAYRPSQVDQGIIKKMETVFRYDLLDLPSGAPVFDEWRLTFGLNYWLGPSMAFKAAYQTATKERAGAGEDKTRAVLFQVAIGF